jgi:hypothetical protein
MQTNGPPPEGVSRAAEEMGERTPSPERADAERRAMEELEAWRAAALPDSSAPLDAEDLVRLLRHCVAALRLDRAIAAEFSVNTVHYYRRKDIIDPPVGRTAASRYDLHHFWQLAGARLAGHLGLVTLAEARDVIRGASEDTARAFLAARIADARGRPALRSARGLPSVASMAGGARPLPSPRPAVASSPATVIQLPGDAWCVLPASHAAHDSVAAADELARALTAALRISRSS